MTSYLYSSPAGIPGAITRRLETTVEPGFLAAPLPLAFGVPLKVIAGGKFAAFEAADTAADFYGVLVRSAPSISGSTAEGFEDSVPNADYAQGIATRGYVNVACVTGTPTRGGAVYVRVANPGVGQAIGDWEADADGADNVLLPDVIWAVEGKDADNNAEIRVSR